MTTREPSHHHGQPDQSGADANMKSGESQTSFVPSQWYSTQGPFRRLGFLLLNVWLVFHLFAIIVCPASVAPSSALIGSGFECVAPYLHLLYLDHGFHYFAPDPGGSTLVGYTVELPDGSTKSGRFPSRDIVPRLYYHRYFMLSEYLGNGPEEFQPLVQRSFARNLCRAYGAIRVTLTLVQHGTPSTKDVRRGVALTDAKLFTETSLGTYTVEELRSPYVPKDETAAENPDSSAKSTDSSKDSP